MSQSHDQELMKASSIGNKELASSLLEQGANASYADPDNNGWTVLMEASTKGHSSVVDLLLKHGASLEQETGCGCTVLTKTACDGTPEMLLLLLSNGANASHTNNKGLSLLEKAESCDNIPVIGFLTEQMPFMVEAGVFAKNVSGISETHPDFN